MRDCDFFSRTALFHDLLDGVRRRRAVAYARTGFGVASCGLLSRIDRKKNNHKADRKLRARSAS